MYLGIGDRRGRRVRHHVLNAILAVASIACAYLLLELAFFRVLLPYASLNIKTHLPDTAGVFVQNSKAAFIPHDYIAILGDSYAEGVGDWLLQANGDRTKPFHSANIIHEATDRDVVSFGRVGAGSAEGLVLRPARILAGTDCYLFPQIETPREIFIYVYEGNDIEENDRFLSHVARQYGNISEASIDRFLVEEYASVSWWKCHTYLADSAARMAKFLFQHHVQGIDFDPNARRENTLIVAGQHVSVPKLHGPGLQYNNNQIRAAMAVFDRSLAWLTGRFPGLRMTVVYIPSPASIYHFGTDALVAGRGTQLSITASPATARQHSDAICDLTEATALKYGADFLDTRPALRRAAETHLIHGPIDWSHFNEAGYRTLGELVVQQTTNSKIDTKTP